MPSFLEKDARNTIADIMGAPSKKPMPLSIPVVPAYKTPFPLHNNSSYSSHASVSRPRNKRNRQSCHASVASLENPLETVAEVTSPYEEADQLRRRPFSEMNGYTRTSLRKSKSTHDFVNSTSNQSSQTIQTAERHGIDTSAIPATKNFSRPRLVGSVSTPNLINQQDKTGMKQISGTVSLDPCVGSSVSSVERGHAFIQESLREHEIDFSQVDGLASPESIDDYHSSIIPSDLPLASIRVAPQETHLKSDIAQVMQQQQLQRPKPSHTHSGPYLRGNNSTSRISINSLSSMEDLSKMIQDSVLTNVLPRSGSSTPRAQNFDFAFMVSTPDLSNTLTNHESLSFSPVLHANDLAGITDPRRYDSTFCNEKRSLDSDCPTPSLSSDDTVSSKSSLSSTCTARCDDAVEIDCDNRYGLENRDTDIIEKPFLEASKKANRILGRAGDSQIETLDYRVHASPRSNHEHASSGFKQSSHSQPNSRKSSFSSILSVNSLWKKK